jgi:hypothetical protein
MEEYIDENSEFKYLDREYIDKKVNIILYPDLSRKSKMDLVIRIVMINWKKPEKI